MTFGKRNQCCCGPIESPCDCTGTFTTFEIGISGVADVDCSGNATYFNGTHTFDRGDGDCNEPHNTDLCWGRKFFKGEECLAIACSYGVATCNTQAAELDDCETLLCGVRGTSEGCACSFVTAYVRQSPTDSVNKMLLQVTLHFVNLLPLDFQADYAVFEADIAKSACTSVSSQSLTLVSSSYIDEAGIDCDPFWPIEKEYPCNKCIDFDSATVTMSLS